MRITRIHVVLLALTGAAGLAIGWPKPGSLALGGAVMALNVWLLKIVTNVLISDPEGSAARSGLAVGAFVLHFGLFMGMAAALFWRVPIDAISFAAGVTLLLIACVIEAVRVGRAVTAQSQRMRA